MSAAVIPVHVAEINGKPLRFFNSRNEEPELPRHALDDLITVCGFDRGQRRHFMRMTEKDWGSDLHVVMTWTGPVKTAPHFIAQGLIDAAVEVGRAPKDTYRKYTEAGMAAMKAITSGMSREAEMDWLLLAARNSTEGDA